MAKDWKAVKAKKAEQDSKKDSGVEQFYTRVLHRAYLRDGDITHRGEALALAMLLHAKGKDRKSGTAAVARMLDDPNAKE